MLQEIPATPGSEAPTTCRGAYCLYPNAIMRPGSHRVSVEKRATTDPKQYSLPYEPIASLSKVRQTPRGPRGQYGLGQNGQEWICVSCFESMLVVYRNRMRRDNPGMTFLPGHPIYEVVYYILAEEREIVGRLGRLSLCSTKHHGLELWKARYLGARRAADPFYIPKNTPGRTEFLQYFSGKDGKSVYLSREDRDYEGRLEDETLAEISGDEVDDCSLTQLLEKLSMRNFTHLSIANRRTAAAKLANYNAYPYENPDEDPEGNKPCHPSRVNPKVPKLRISQATDDEPSLLASCLPAPKPAPSTAPTPAVTGAKRHPLVLLAASKNASGPETATKIDSDGPETAREHCAAGLLMTPLLGSDPLEIKETGGGVGASVTRRSRSASL